MSCDGRIKRDCGCASQTHPYVVAHAIYAAVGVLAVEQLGWRVDMSVCNGTSNRRAMVDASVNVTQR